MTRLLPLTALTALLALVLAPTTLAQTTQVVVAWGSLSPPVPSGLTDVVAVAPGIAHAVALKDDGTVVAWGFNNEGQTDVPPGLSGAVAVAAGNFHSVALQGDGTVVAWGSNNDGQTNVPPGLTGVIAVAAGTNHTVALKDDGTVVAWGWNFSGQTDVPAGLSDVAAIAAGSNHTVALRNDGTVAVWGTEFLGITTVPAGLTGVTAIAAGFDHTLALKDDGTVVAWGYNSFGQTSVPVGLTGVTGIAAGSRHTVALRDDGTVVAWGFNAVGQTDVPADLNSATAVAAGSDYSVALRLVCAPGSFGDTGAPPCTPAPPGTFVAEAGATEATPAPAGFFVDQEGAIQATACALGRYQPESGQTSCLVAPVGFYVDVTGASAATACPDGQTTSEEGAASADACFAPNAPPTAVATGPEVVIVGQNVNLDGANSSDPDGDALTFAWTLDGDPLSDAVSPAFCAAEVGPYTATLVVNDGAVDSEPVSVTVTALSAEAALDVLIADVAATPGLNGGQTNALTRKLEQAQRKLDRGQDPSGQFGAFRSQTLSLEADGVLDPGAADALVAGIDRIAVAVDAPCSAAASAAGLASATLQAEALAFGLDAPYPNPMNGRASVAFTVEDAMAVRLTVYDALGREVAVLVDRTVEAGRHTTRLDGASLPTGTYLVRLTAGVQTATRRLTRLR